MRTRANLRCLAALGVLHEEGPCCVRELEIALRARPGALHAELAFLEAGGLIVGEEKSDHPDRPARIVYHATKAPGAVSALLAQLEQLGERNVRLCTALDGQAATVAQAVARAEAAERRVAELEAAQAGAVAQ